MIRLLTIFIFIFFASFLVAQEVNTAETKKAEPAKVNPDGKKPVRDPWVGNILIDNQTTLQSAKGTFEYSIYHRFTGLGNGIEDFFGIYGASNIRLGINYGLTDKISIGFGTEKEKQYQEFTTKIKLLTQNRDNSIPISISFYGNACINGAVTSKLGSNFKHIDRLSYFSELLISRKFNDNCSFQIGASFSHFNKVASTQIITEDDTSITTTYKGIYQNQAIGISALGRYKIINDISFIAAFEQGFYLNPLEIQQMKPKPNLAFGFEKGTSTHSFQLFLTSARGIVQQHNYVMNQFDFNYIDNMLIGFNVTINL